MMTLAGIFVAAAALIAVLLWLAANGGLLPQDGPSRPDPRVW